MAKLKRVSGQQAIRALEKLGYVQIRQKGSHVILKKSDQTGIKGCVVPLHGELAIGTLRGVLRQAGITIDEFLEALK